MKFYVYVGHDQLSRSLTPSNILPDGALGDAVSMHT